MDFQLVRGEIIHHAPAQMKLMTREKKRTNKLFIQFIPLSTVITDTPTDMAPQQRRNLRSRF
jgi:hypothetical protein